ncbi:hypothetical protein HQQ94_05515 [Shewanella sp. VB17]|uniref:hypothetical protein n=1 Tax=Shewanella sp. VB17 TaxID=2739432 RepID=UPI001566CCEE|nr:hypothetical protein [Shewanella sp. VB17]NRD72715.1 hypothetical protein [Shewanella sp. VB17]
MSLEQQITALVTSSNALTEVVDGKIREIDEKVAEVTSIVESTIRSKMVKTFYLHQTTGNDSNSGSRENPIRTLSEVSKRVIPGGCHRVILLDDYRFDPKLDNDQWTFAPLLCTIMIIGDGSSKDFTFVAHPRHMRWVGRTQNVSSRIDTSSGVTIGMENLRLRLDKSQMDDGYELNSRFVLFSTNASFTYSPMVKVRFHKCDLSLVLGELPEGTFLLEKTNNFAVIVARSCVYPNDQALLDKLILDATQADKLQGSIYTDMALRTS